MTQIILTVIFVQLLENRVYFEIFFCLQEKNQSDFNTKLHGHFSEKKSHFKAYSAQTNG